MKYLKIFEAYDPIIEENLVELFFAEHMETFRIYQYVSNRHEDDTRIMDIIIRRHNLNGGPFSSKIFKSRIEQLIEYLGDGYEFMYDYSTYKKDCTEMKYIKDGNLYSLKITILKRK